MNTSDAAKILGGLIGSWLVIGWIFFILLYAFMPLMLFSIMRSMKGIRRELSTLNETLQQRLTLH